MQAWPGLLMNDYVCLLVDPRNGNVIGPEKESPATTSPCEQLASTRLVVLLRDLDLLWWCLCFTRVCMLSMTTLLWWLLALCRLQGVVTSSAATTSSSSLSSSSQPSQCQQQPQQRRRRRQKLVLGIDGGTESIRACCFDAQTGRVVGKSCASPYLTFHPHPGWAEQRPQDWWHGLGLAVRGAVASLQQELESNIDDDDADGGYEICCLCVDTTCCSVVALDDYHRPLCNCLLWMDARSAQQTQHILEVCRGDPALQVNCGGEGPISAEWMTPKALWIRNNEPTIWDQATTICEYQDYINYRLTGEMIASSCNAASRWHWDGEKCIQSATRDDPYPGRPMSLYEKLGIPELAQKLPQRSLPMGSLVGHLTEDAARHLHLPAGTPVAQGGPDAFVGMVGLGCVRPGQLCLITGSSHLHCVITSHPTTAPGTWGAYKGAPLPGINFAEGGQSSTGSILRWAKGTLLGAGDDVSYADLDDEAARIRPGADGLVALETFQGSRTPMTDPLARGALVGLTLSHTRAHIWRALMEAVCFGTRACLEALDRAGHPTTAIVIAGGTTRSDVWLQMHADVTGKEVIVREFADAPLLGCAILASVNAGVHKTVEEAVASMVRQSRRILPNPETTQVYDELYQKTYAGLADATRSVSHAVAGLRGGSTSAVREATEQQTLDSIPIISPSLLACDWCDIGGEVQRCLDAGAKRLHVDVFDGVFLDSPLALTFGPKMVQAIRKCTSDDIILDLHLCVDRPERYIGPMREAAGEAATFIFQWEAARSIQEALEIARAVVQSGMMCGISINPSTNIEAISPILDSRLISVVDILSVEPGFGGQSFQMATVAKLEEVAAYRAKLRHATSSNFQIMVDGGINVETARTIRHVETDVLVAGTFLFQHPISMEAGFTDLESSSS